MAELITSAFARIGDKRKPPVTDATGAVNMDNGYTPNYEIDLASGDPLAKAVERDVQNYLFWLLTDNVMQYQSLGFPEWSAAKPGGYSAGAYVSIFNNGSYSTYRSQANNNTSNPIGSSTWDEIWTSSRLRGIVPMPLGGLGYISGGNLPAGSNVLSLTDGTYIIQTDAIAGQIANLPVAKAGVLEVKNYTNGGAASAMYRYNSVSNDTYWLNTGPGSTGAWNRGINNNEIGYTNGFIPRVQQQGFSIQDNGSNYFKIGTTQNGDPKWSEVFVDSTVASGGIPSGLAFGYGNFGAKLGLTRGSADGSVTDLRLMIGTSVKFVIAPSDLGDISFFSTGFGINGASPQLYLRNQNGAGIATLGADQNNGTLSIWTNSGTSAIFRHNGMYFQGKTTGENSAMVSGQVDAGAWNDWKVASSALGISIATLDAANTVWKATNWGTNHTAAMQVLHPANQANVAIARLVLFGGAGKAEQQFMFSGSGEFGALKGTFTNVQVNTLLSVGDTDSGLRAKSDGQVSIWSNNSEIGYFGQIPNVNLSGTTTGIRLSGELMASSVHLTNEAGGRGITFTTAPNQPASRITISAWGNNTGRSTVLEASDSSGYLMYAQRDSQGRVDVQSAGFFTLDTGAEGYSFRALSATFFYKGGTPVGGGGFGGQLDAMAPFYQKIDTRPNGDNNYYPLVKGRINIASGYPVAYSFGVVTSGTTFANIVIQAKTDYALADRLWFFNVNDGSFNCPGTVYAGGGRLATDGNLYGGAWTGGGANGWLNDWVGKNFVNQVAFGAVETTQVWRGYGYADQPPFVITGVKNDTADEYIDWVARRPLRYARGGSWIDVGTGA